MRRKGLKSRRGARRRIITQPDTGDLLVERSSSYLAGWTIVSRALSTFAEQRPDALFGRWMAAEERGDPAARKRLHDEHVSGRRVGVERDPLRDRVDLAQGVGQSVGVARDGGPARI